MNAFRVVVLAVMVMFLSGSEMVSGLEATWTPNEADDGGGPLPLSQAQRDQLSQLDATIAQSENPEAMLAKVAESNGMSAQELGSMLINTCAWVLWSRFSRTVNYPQQKCTWVFW